MPLGLGLHADSAAAVAHMRGNATTRCGFVFNSVVLTCVGQMSVLYAEAIKHAAALL